MTEGDRLIDSHGRVLRDLRVSITDRCNFRCMYCLPETEAAQNFYRGHWAHMPNSAPIVQQWVPRTAILCFEEIERVVRIAVGLGIHKIRLTGGEPLLRHNVENLVARNCQNSRHRRPGNDDQRFSVRAERPARCAKPVCAASASASIRSTGKTSKRSPAATGWAKCSKASGWREELGFDPVKVNAVVIREINDHEIESLAEFAREHNLNFRFIEFMPLDSARAWQKEMVVSGAEILQRLGKTFRPASGRRPNNPSSTSKRWAFPDGRGEIGIIAPVSEPFCGHCNRIRLTADGKIRTCLFSVTEHDLRSLLRNGSSDDANRRMAQGRRLAKGSAASHRRDRFRDALAFHELHWRIRARWENFRVCQRFELR